MADQQGESMMKRLALWITFGLLILALVWTYAPRKPPETGFEKLFRNRDAAMERHAREWIEYLVGDWSVTGTALGGQLGQDFLGM